MAQRLTINYAKKPCYDIVFTQDFQGLGEELETLQIKERRICIITDSNVEKLYAQEVLNQLNNRCKKTSIFSFPAGEANKTYRKSRIHFSHPRRL